MNNKIYIVCDKIHNINVAAFLEKKNAADFVNDQDSPARYAINQFDIEPSNDDDAEIVCLIHEDKPSLDEDKVVAAFFDSSKAESWIESAAKDNSKIQYYYQSLLVVEDSPQSQKARLDDWGYCSDGEYLLF